jgi:secondary thiamine-phosphate synthase enzyme
MERISVSTRHREELMDITAAVQDVIANSGIASGICIVYCPHTTGAITVNEGADPAVARDIVTGLGRLIPLNWDFAHMEGNSDAHLKASLIGPSETIVVDNGRPVLGTWQKIFFCEFDGPRNRTCLVRVLKGDAGG